MHYFDHNATTPLAECARESWLTACSEFSGNPSSPHRMGARADRALTEAREELGTILGCHALDIVWTGGASESANMVFSHFAKTLDFGTEVWVSAIEHPCVLETAREYFGEHLREIPVSKDGVLDVASLRQKLSQSRPGLVAAMAANNETGVVQPWRDVQEFCRESGTPFFCDAAQWLGKLPSMGLGDCDFVSGCAHKFGGPKGVGFLKTPDKGKVEPLIFGGPQEEGRRAGTENVAGVMSMMAALSEREIAFQTTRKIEELGRLRKEFEVDLIRELPSCRIVGDGCERLWNTVSVVMPESDCRVRWVVKLDKAGVAVSTGSACSSGKEAPSHVLSTMGLTAAEAGRVLRFSSGWETKKADWDALLSAVKKVWADISA